MCMIHAGSFNINAFIIVLEHLHVHSTCSITVWGIETCCETHKEIIRRENNNWAMKKILAGSWYQLVLAVAPCHLAARKSCSFLTSFLSIRLFLCSQIADRWQMERRRSSAIHSTGYNCSTTDWLLPSGLLCKLYIACLYPFVSSRPSSRRELLVYPSLA